VSLAERTASLGRSIAELRTLYRETWLGYLLVAPAVAMVTVVILYPTAVGVYTALLEKSLLFPEEAQFVGLDNFVRALSDPVFVGALGRSVLLTAVAVTLEYLLGLGLALALVRRLPGIGIFRSLTMVPWVLPTVVMVTIFNFMVQPQFGLVNDLLDLAGLPTRYWFGDPATAFPLVVAMHVWQNVPFFAVALMAGMMSVPEELYEAAKIDGAGRVARFRHVTLPNISQVSMIMIVLHVIYTFNNFDIVYLSTGGGPLNRTEVLATYVYRTGFLQNALGYGSAVGTVMLLLMLVFTAVYLRVEEVER
jgi:ABC-type sugar transport system permease subunit